jgi:nucleoside-diphosphate-sugar epimerase
VVAKMAGDAIVNKKIIVTDGGSQVRAFTHIDDMTNGLTEIIQRLYNGDCSFLNQIFNVGSPKNAISMINLAETIRNAVFKFSAIESEIESMNSAEFYKGKFDDIQKRIPCMDKWNNFFETRFNIEIDEIIYEICKIGCEELGVFKK